MSELILIFVAGLVILAVITERVIAAAEWIMDAPLRRQQRRQRELLLQMTEDMTSFRWRR